MPMTRDDVWTAAQGVRMWLATAEQCFDGSKRRGFGGGLLGWLSRGQVGGTQIREGVDALGKMRVAFLDLELALRLTGMEPIALDTLHLTIASADAGVATRVVVDEHTVAELRTLIAADLYSIDRLCSQLEATR